MLCQWPKCSKEAGAMEWCKKPVCDKHRRTIEEVGIPEARRILGVEDTVVTGFRFVGVTPFRWPRKRKDSEK